MSKTVGLERAPVSEIVADFRAGTPRFEDSAFTFKMLMEHYAWTCSYLKLGESDQFVLTPEAIDSRRQQLQTSKEGSYKLDRDIQQIGILIGATVSQMETEFRHSLVLDIGCGTGRFGKEIERKAKARVVYFERDALTLSSLSRQAQARTLGDGKILPFLTDRVPKSVSSFSALSWAESPVDAHTSFTEAVRVTAVDGTFFAIPLCSRILGRHSLGKEEAFSKITGKPLEEDPVGLRVWALQDHLILRTLTDLIQKGYCSVTWSSWISKGERTGVQIDSYSAIIDKISSIPAAVMASHMDYARSFLPGNKGGQPES